MQVEFLVNGNEGVSLLMAPENPMEEELIKQLLKQQNDITQIRTAVVVLNKTFRNGIFIGKKTMNLEQENTTNSESSEG